MKDLKENIFKDIDIKEVIKKGAEYAKINLTDGEIEVLYNRTFSDKEDFTSLDSLLLLAYSSDIMTELQRYTRELKEVQEDGMLSKVVDVKLKVNDILPKYVEILVSALGKKDIKDMTKTQKRELTKTATNMLEDTRDFIISDAQGENIKDKKDIENENNRRNFIKGNIKKLLSENSQN